MLDQGPVLVVWAFDQSESMKDDQKEIRQRIEHVYTRAWPGEQGEPEQALETAVVSYGDAAQFQGAYAAADLRSGNEIMSAIDQVPNDTCGQGVHVLGCARIDRASIGSMPSERGGRWR